MRWPVSSSTTLPDDLPLPAEAYSISVAGPAHPEAHPTKLLHQEHHHAHHHHHHEHQHQHGGAIEYNAKFARWLKGVRQEVSRACFQLLFFSIRKSHGNQIFAARSLSVFVTHSSEISCGSVAIRCIREMLHENRELQESEISEREVNVFINMIHSSPLNPLFLDLLTAVCVCNG